MAIDFNTLGDLTYDEAKLLISKCETIDDLAKLVKHTSGIVANATADSTYLLFSGGLPNGLDKNQLLGLLLEGDIGGIDVPRLRNVVSIGDSEVAGLLNPDFLKLDGTARAEIIRNEIKFIMEGRMRPASASAPPRCGISRHAILSSMPVNTGGSCRSPRATPRSS
ncbi:hypothetical protein [Massilia scottii]|uniref:hypothetical protein n=1 Tax=Massilia scottii TaxID=3057166 RepID=UPI002796451A|nr:hypothetical protein [Massilia sp. CCM 9029]MDQ1829715.1 hypothetical protein [Massilia sp. CCM 9029]